MSPVGQKRKSSRGHGMSAAGGRAEVDTRPESQLPLPMMITRRATPWRKSLERHAWAIIDSAYLARKLLSGPRSLRRPSVPYRCRLRRRCRCRSATVNSMHQSGASDTRPLRSRAVWAKGVMWVRSDRGCHAALTKCISGTINQENESWYGRYRRKTIHTSLGQKNISGNF